MDIDYLLLLQSLREATGGMFDELFNAISKFAVDILPLLPYIIFWCVDKKWGYRFITTLGVGEVINGILKLTVCAYRPWIRSDLIEGGCDRIFFPKRSYDVCDYYVWDGCCLAVEEETGDRYILYSYDRTYRLFEKLPRSPYTPGCTCWTGGIIAYRVCHRFCG